MLMVSQVGICVGISGTCVQAALYAVCVDDFPHVDLSPSICRGCGCGLAHDHDAAYCSPCAATRRDYNPCHDPLFGDILLALLQENHGVRVHVHRELGITHCTTTAWHCVKSHVRRLRRHGYLIVGAHDGTYTYMGHADGPAVGRGAAAD